MKIEEILALLAGKFTGARKDGLTQLARVIALQGLTGDETKALVEKLTDVQVGDFIKEFRSDVDKEATEARKTYEANLRKKFDLVERKGPGEGDSDSGDGKDAKDDPVDMPALVKAAVAEAVKPLQGELEKYRAGDVAKARLQSLNDKLNGCKDVHFREQTLKDFARIRFESDDAFSEYLAEKEAAIATANQNAANAALGSHGKPLFTQKDETGISKGVADYVAGKKPENDMLSGKEV
jgi:hypothetical protein